MMLLQLRRDHESVTETGEIRNDATAEIAQLQEKLCGFSTN